MTTEKQKVFVLTRISTISGEGKLTTRAFRTKKDAVGVMNNESDVELNDWKEWCGEENIKLNINEEDMLEIYESGAASYNSEYWKISEHEI